MKKGLRFLGIMILLAVFGFMFAGCEIPDEDLVGKWELKTLFVKTADLEFKAGNKVSVVLYIMGTAIPKIDYDYVIVKKNITLSQSGDEFVSAIYEIKGRKLKISGSEKIVILPNGTYNKK